MSIFATINLTHHGLELRCPAANLTEDRPLADADPQRLEDWAKRYLEAAAKDDHHKALLALGEEMHDWLNGPSSFFTRALEAAAAPLLVEFAVSRQDCEQEAAQAFLNAPWELLASGGKHWALRDDLAFCPIRRIGKAAAPPPPSASRLGLVFMAAAPRGADTLDYEAEEASILAATRNLGLDLAVEESGTLELLSACVAREKPEVIQISCHGTLRPRPGLRLEDDLGDKDIVEATDLGTRLTAHHPRLLFLDACKTAQTASVLPSLARSLVLAGAPAVLGWAASVRDREATIFAASLYQHLTSGDDLAQALACARLELANHDQLAPSGSHGWHLARLFLSPGGGGALATAGGPQRHLGQGQAVKTFLDAKGKHVPVAGELEFVGRRREIQAILREFRAPTEQRHAGVLIHGLGRQGKSSLAARVAHRLEHTHETVVIFGRYDAPYILRTLGERLATPAVTNIVGRHLPLVEADKSKLLPALTDLLAGPCAQGGDHGAKPVLLVIDDFERALDEQNHRTLKPEHFDSIRALLLAFQAAATESHLLFTCRFQFTCPHDGKDLADADHLLDVPLRGMNEREAQKQAGAKLRVPEVARVVARLSEQKLTVLKQQVERIIAGARGNPGLQDLLFTLALQDPTACDRCLAQMEEFLRSGKLPAEDNIRAFLENLALQSLTGLLTPAQHELLRAATLFDLPVPVPVMRTLAQALGGSADFQSAVSPTSSRQGVGAEPGTAGWKPAIRQIGNLRYEEDCSRLLALGLWEVYEDLHDPQTQALALNALVRPLAGALSETEKAAPAGVVTGALFEQWGGETGGKQRGWLQDHELTRLGLLARDARVLAATGADALRFLANQFQYQQAAAWAKAILAIVDATGVSASVDLLRTAAERCQQVGEVAEANAFRERAMKLLGQGGEADAVQNAATLITHARALVEQGQPDEALRHLEQAKALLPRGREQAIVTGEIAMIRAAKGEVDAALKLHQERLRIVEALGDKRERALTLGDIARIRAAKGEVNAALKLHQEELQISKELGDIDGVAHISWAMAKIEVKRQQWQEAYDHLAEAYAIELKLGRLDGICFVGLDLGQLLCMAGQRKEGLAILTRSRDGFLKLGQAQGAQHTQALLDQLAQ